MILIIWNHTRENAARLGYIMQFVGSYIEPKMCCSFFIRVGKIDLLGEVGFDLDKGQSITIF